MLKGYKNRILCRAAALIAALAFTLSFSGCEMLLNDDSEDQYAVHTQAPAPTAAPTDAPTEAPTAEPTEAPTEEPTEEPTPEPTATPEPTPRTASMGFAGDVLMMQSQINAARTSGGYNFKPSFRPMQGLFESVDFMVLNFEGTLAGKDAGYTEPKPEVGFQRFNVPDEIVDDLMALGVDGFSTANNHCLDKDVAGLLRTVEVMDAKDVFHTGTFSSPERQRTADIVEINGIKVGFVSTTDSINSYDWILSSEQASYMINRLKREQMTRDAIVRCRDQGAELVVVMAHWGTQYQKNRNGEQVSYAKKLISWGADVIIGCHPHVVQEIEWVSAERGGSTVTAPVVYSMSNFISNMSSSVHATDVGIFVRVDIEKDAYGNVSVTEISYVPTYDSIRWDSAGRYCNEVIPCFDDMTGVVTSAGAASYRHGIRRAQEYCAQLIKGVKLITNPLA